MDKLLQLEGIDHAYGKEIRTQVLFDVSLGFEKGEFTAIIGRSGSGKSTLLNIIGTLDRPEKGRLLFEGEDLLLRSDDQLSAFRNQSLGFVFQFHYLLPEFTALENVLIPYRIAHGRITPEAQRKAKELIDRVGVADRMNNKSVNLSGGQQQRIAIARALIQQPKIILADEPTGNLDTESSEAVFSLLREINQELDSTFIIVTHDRHIAGSCDRVVEMRDGRIFEDFKTGECTEDEKWGKMALC